MRLKMSGFRHIPNVMSWKRNYRQQKGLLQIVRITCFLLFFAGGLSVLLLVNNSGTTKWSQLLRDAALSGVPEHFRNFEAIEPWFTTKAKRIVFIETSEGEICFDYRQSCAVESTAYRNPDANIILFLRAKNISANCQTLELFTNSTTPDGISNVKIVHYDLEQIFENTPLLEWGRAVERGDITSPYMSAHLSDALRLALVHKYNAVYMDLDFITLRSLDKMFKLDNFVVKQGDADLSNGMLGFRRPHNLTLAAMREFAATYDGFQWSKNGLLLLTRILTRWGCNLNSSACGDISFVAPEHIYPVSYWKWQLLFKANSSVDGLTLLNDKQVLTLHLWNFLSKGTASPTSLQNVINVCAQNSCPRSFELAKHSKDSTF